MNRNPKLLLNGVNTGDGRQTRFASAKGPHILDDLGRKLVPFLGPTMLGKQAAQARLLEGRLGLIHRGA